ncbi:hypothetical protein [Mangrovibacterium marinum]|uniref:Uncharacterized protein n=1 Tax=Mangrovibacterium marinum TaxID=1639118 RepID=A0A2T5C2C0_9BACT|nr:hypothetical protein [Mangrovibacterium marinum]PTN08817.1 hypothetical protein C8N47_107178 [Mangrovibacterium marinum]
MDAKHFFTKLFSANKSTHTPPVVLTRFNQQFEHPLNVEWQKIGDQFEALFYKNELEHIARYAPTGEMTNLKVNLPLEQLPENIEAEAKKHGELMNVIRIENGKILKFELIVRDRQMNRYFLLISHEGEVIEKEKL